MFIISGLLIVIGYFYIQKNKDIIRSNHGNELNYFLKERNEPFIDSLSLPEFKLIYSDDVQRHLDQLNESIENQSFEDYQNKNNWCEGQFITNQDTLPIQLRMHGRTPASHSIHDFYSLAIRTETPIMNQNRFNLIIYERIMYTSDRIMMLAETFHLFTQKDRLIDLRINTNEPHLYYLETPLKKELLASHGLVNYEIGDQRSPIYTSTIDFNAQDEKLGKKIRGQEKTSPFEREKQLARYRAFNKAIKNKDVDSIHQFVDINYIARFQCARAISGFTNHGFGPENMIFALDTTTLLFYPLLHRDHYMGSYSQEQFNQSERHPEETIRILELLTENAIIKERTRSYWTENSEEKTQEMIKKMGAIDLKHARLFLSKLTGNTEEIPPVPLRENGEKWNIYLTD